MVLTRFISIPSFTSGERLNILNQMHAIATQMGFLDVVATIEAALLHDRATCDLDNRWTRRSRGRFYEEDVGELDTRVDAVHVSIRDIAQAQVRALDAGDPLASQVESFLAHVYPAGVAALITLPYVDQVAATEVVLDRLQATDPTLLARLGLTERVAHLAQLTVAYRAAVVRNSELSFDAVQASRDAGQRLLRELIAQVLGQLADSLDADKVAQREALLAPIVRMSMQARRRRLQRRNRAANGEQVAEDGGDLGDGELEDGELEDGELEDGELEDGELAAS